ncbi:MAG: hypothetical protein OEY67_07375 [Gammaproteobacteria bacterium]|nr:hypothetical protein [Gammaproteobacteria bacterium]
MILGPAGANGYLKVLLGYGGNRFYTLTYQSEDAVGNVGACDVVVVVPHDQGNN